jgi:hypothetical protein
MRERTAGGTAPDAYCHVQRTAALPGRPLRPA